MRNHIRGSLHSREPFLTRSSMFTATISEKPTLHEVRDQLHAAADYLIGLERVDHETRDATWIQDTRSAVDFIHRFDPVAQAMETGHSGLQQGGGPVGATALLGNYERRSAGDILTNLDEYKTFAESRQASATFREFEIPGSLLVDNHEVRTLVDSGTAGGTGTGDAGMWRDVGTPLPPRGIRQTRIFIRDFVTVQGTTLASVPYIRELNAAGNNEVGASGVAEGVAKPEVTMDFEQDNADVRKIAAWIPATEEIIDDAPTLRGYIDTRLAYMLALREEMEILSGPGGAVRLKGILQFTGLQTQAFSVDVASTLGLAIGKVENVDGDADGIVMNPIKYWTMITTRSANQFDNGFGTGAPFGTPVAGVWGLPVVRTRVLTLNKAIVGAWRLGATVFDRMRTTIKVGNQHSTYFIENKVAILAEERLGLAVHRADFFVDTDLV